MFSVRRKIVFLNVMFFECMVLLLCHVNILDFRSSAVPRDGFRLDIVHYNDFHDRFEETSVAYPICKTNDDQCLGGFPRLYYEVKALLRENPDALLLNAGDTFQGTYWYTLMRWNITQTFINMLPNDAHALGNHEFDDGIVGLAPYLAGLTAPVVAANIDTSKEPLLKGLYKPHVILERRGRKIGVIGLITPDTATLSNSQEVDFLDPLKVVQREAQLLTEKGVDIIIVLSHCGLPADIKMAKKVGKHIDIIVGGHSHSLLWNGTSPSNEKVSGPYPILVETETKPGHKVLVVTASADSKYLGNLSVYFDMAGELQTFDGNPVFLNRSIPEDPDIKALMQPYKDKLHDLVHEVLGYSNEDLLRNLCGKGECAIGDLTADAFLSATHEIFKSKLPSVAFIISNLIRGSLSKGAITRGGVINALPFSNRVVTFVLSGRHLLKVFERCLTKYWDFQPFNGPWMPQISGMKLILNSTEGRVLSASVKVGESYQEVDPDEDYQVTTIQFLVKGGIGFTMLKEHARGMTPVGTDADIIENYIKKVSPIKAVLDYRLTVVH